MNYMATVSVVMTTYNGEKYILEQLSSIFAQSCLPNQIIIADDCSRDKTNTLVRNFLETNKTEIEIISYTNKNNLGYIKNFRNAILKATGDYVLLCDQDDVWEKDKIKTTIAVMQKLRKDVACTGFKLIDSTGVEINEKKLYRSDPINGYENWSGKVYKVTLARLLWGNFSPGCTYCFTQRVLDIYRNLSNLEMSHDFQLILIGACLDSAIFIDKPLSSYRLHSSNTVGMNQKEKKRKRHFKPRMIRFLDELARYCPVNINMAEKLALYFRLPKIRSVIIHKFGLENKMKLKNCCGE